MNKFNFYFKLNRLTFNYYAIAARGLNTNSARNQLGVAFNQKPTRDSSSSTTNFSSSLSSSSSSSVGSSSNRFAKFVPLILNSTADKSQNEPTTGLFGIKELYVHQGFYLLKDRAEKRVNELLEEAFNDDQKSSRRKLVQIFDDISNELCRVADLAEFVRSTHPDAEFRESADQTFGHISQIVEKLNTNFKLYSKLKRETESVERIEEAKLDDCDIRVSKLYLLDFEQSGIHLDERTRNKFVHVNDDLINVLMKFQINSQTPTLLSTQEVDKKFNQMYKHHI